MGNNDKQATQDEPIMPDPQEADQKPSEDLSNEIKKGGTETSNSNS